MELTRDEVQAWIKTALAQTGETPSALARRAGLATTTLTRFMNDPEAPMLTLRSLAKIAHVADIQPIGLPSALKAAAQQMSRGMSEGEAVPYKINSDAAGVDRALVDLIAGRPSSDPWLLTKSAVDALGYRDGDIVIVDLNSKPHAGDVVCAQVYEWSKGQAETIFRVFEPPYLVVATHDPILATQLRKPLLVDNDRVIIKGVVTELVRVRAA